MLITDRLWQALGIIAILGCATVVIYSATLLGKML